MAFFSQIVSVSLLTYVLLNSKVNAQYFPPYDFNNYYDGCNPCGQSNPATDFLPVLPPPLVPAPCIAPNDTIPCNNGSSSAGGNALYLVFDPITQTFSMRVAPPCNLTTNGTQPSGGNDTSPSGNGTSPSSPGSGVCSVSSLIAQIVDAVLNLFNQFLQNLISAILNSFRNLLDSVVSPLVDTFLANVEASLNKTLSAIQDNIENFVNTTSGGSPGNNSAISTLLNNVERLLNDQLHDANLPQEQIDRVTANVTQVLNSTFQGLFNNIDELEENVRDPNSTQALLPGLTQNVTTLINNTIQGWLDDFDESVQNLLNATLIYQSLMTNLTRDVETLLTNKLNDSICDFEKLLNDTDAFSKLIDDLGEQFQNLLGDVLRNTSNALSDRFQRALDNVELFDQLRRDLFRLLNDEFTNLLNSKIRAAQSMIDPNFKNQIMRNLTDSITSILNQAFSNPPPSIPVPTNGSIPTDIPTLPIGLIPQISQQIENSLNETFRKVSALVSGLSGQNNTLIMGPINDTLQEIEQSWQDLRNGSLRGVQSSINGTFSNDTSGIINSTAIKSSLNTLFTNILQQLKGCNVTCGAENSTTPPTPPANCTPSIPCPCPCPCTQSPCNGPPFCNPDCSASVDSFLNQLQRYQSAVAQNTYENFNPSGSPNLFDNSANSDLDSLASLGSSFEDGDLGSCQHDILGGLEKTLKLTNNVAVNGLIGLVNSITKQANSSNAVALPVM